MEADANSELISFLKFVRNLFRETEGVLHDEPLITPYAGIIAMLAIFSVSPFARAQKEFPPPQGKGRVVVVSSGASGPEHYETVSRAIAQLGYDVVLFDGNRGGGNARRRIEDSD